jgi:hypothetical protein
MTSSLVQIEAYGGKMPMSRAAPYPAKLVTKLSLKQRWRQDCSGLETVLQALRMTRGRMAEKVNTGS